MSISSVGETICRQYFEALFGVPFSKIKPEWLLNSKGNRQELDGFSPDLKLAFEYNGHQHYQITDVFCKEGLTPIETLQNRISDDTTKRQKCKEMGIELIEISHSIPHREIGEYIVNECKKLGVDVPYSDLKNLDYTKFKTHQAAELLRNKRIANQLGGDCLSTDYIDSHTKLKYRCKEGHEWLALPTSITCLRTWCPRCAGYNQTIADMQKFAATKEGFCRSDAYGGAMTKLEWECKEGHRWFAEPNSVINTNHWCRKCFELRAHHHLNYKKNLTIEQLQSFASSKGGKCRSTIYINNRVPLEWECAMGHVWCARPSNVHGIKGTWCPVCARKRPKP